jgi:hypothetical protein
VDVDLVVKVSVIAAVLVVWWVLADLRRYRDLAVRAGQALHVAEPSPPPPPGPPIEEVAADIRRIGGQIRQASPGMPVARMRGWVAAYDDVLVVACEALALEHRLRSTPEGAGRDLERERVERLIERAGLRVRAW